MWHLYLYNVCLLLGSRTYRPTHGRRAARKPLSGGTDPAAAEPWRWSQHPQPGERPARSFTAERRQRRESERLFFNNNQSCVYSENHSLVQFDHGSTVFNQHGMRRTEYTLADTSFPLSLFLSLSSSSSWRRKVPPLGDVLHPYRTKSD